MLSSSPDGNPYPAVPSFLQESPISVLTLKSLHMLRDKYREVLSCEKTSEDEKTEARLQKELMEAEIRRRELMAHSKAYIDRKN